jgi:hypothetical protein
MRRQTLGSQRKFRFSLRRLMAAVAIISVLLAMFVPTARMRVDWAKPRIDDLIVMLTLMLAEAIVVYYAVLAVVIARGLLNRDRTGDRVSSLFTYAPVLVTIVLIALLGALDAFLSR